MLFEKIQLESDEQVLQLVRKHWFVFLAKLFASVIALLIPFFILTGLLLSPEALSSYNISLGQHTGVIAFIMTGWLLLTLLMAFTIWTHYYLDLWVITDRRIILVDQIKFFSRTVSSFRLERLQDIEYSVSGLIPTFLNFGSVRAQTASNIETNFHTTGLPDPRALQATIQKAMDKRLQTLYAHRDADL